MIVFFFVKQKTAYEMRISDWSSDVCSSDLIASESPELARFQPRALVRQLQASLARELDLAAECRNAERIAASFADEPALLVPTVHWQWTSERVNVQAFIDGIPLSDIDAIEAACGDRCAIARLGAQAELKMLFAEGFFPADPHPGDMHHAWSGTDGSE